jgi:hypothetical protein
MKKLLSAILFFLLFSSSLFSDTYIKPDAPGQCYTYTYSGTSYATNVGDARATTESLADLYCPEHIYEFVSGTPYILTSYDSSYFPFSSGSCRMGMQAIISTVQPPATCSDGSAYDFSTCSCPAAPPTCEPPLVLDDTNTSCVALTCEQPELLSEDGSYCYVPTCGTNSSYNYTINLCECDVDHVLTQVPDQDAWCQPDTDGDGLGDTTADPYPDDKDNDGIPDSIDTSPNSPATTPPDAVADKCSKYPTSLQNYGWNSIGSFGGNCNLAYQNEVNDGSVAYYSDTDDTTCSPSCLVFFTQCIYPKTYDHASRSCVSASDADAECIPDPSTTMVVKRGDVCYNQTSCFDTGKVSSSDLVDCPDADIDGTPDNNITIEGTQEAVLGALIKHGAATTFKQEELIEQSKISNTKLAEIEISTKKNGTLLGNIDAKIKANGTLNHTDLSKIDTSIKAMNDSLLDPNRLANSMNLATTANGIEDVKDKLDEIKGLLQAETDIPDQSDSIAAMNGLVSDSQGVFDGLYTDLDNAMGEVSDKIGLVQNGFNITATKSVVTTCPIIRDFDTGERIIPVPLDICKVTNTFYPAGYMLSYGAVLFGAVSFFLLILLGGV